MQVGKSETTKELENKTLPQKIVKTAKKKVKKESTKARGQDFCFEKSSPIELQSKISIRFFELQKT